MRYEADQKAYWTDLLSREERARLHGFGSEKRRHQFMLGRAAARLLLADMYNTKPEAVALCVADDGAVEVEGRPCTLSITHAGPYAVAAIGPQELGVDLEHIQPRARGISRFLLHPDERGLLDRLPLDREHGVILCWTLKEAALKASRIGLRLFPNKLRVFIDVPGQTARVEGPGTAIWRVPFEERNGFYLAFAYPD